AHIAALDVVLQKLAGAAVVDGGNRSPARDDEVILGRGEVALRRDSREGGARVLLDDVLAAAAAVRPDHFARLRVERVEEDAHEGPDARSEVDLVVVDDRCAARGPHRDQAVIAEDLAIRRSAAELPEEASVFGVERIEPTVIRDEEYAVAPDRRREAHGAVDEVRPSLLARLRVDRDEAILDHRRDEEGLAAQDGLVEPVELELPLGFGPRWRGRSALGDPLGPGGGGELRFRRSGRRRGPTPLRPVATEETSMCGRVLPKEAPEDADYHPDAAREKDRHVDGSPSIVSDS